MAPWDADRFVRLEQLVFSTVEGKRPVVGVPYYIFLYNPAEELRAIDEFQNLERRLKAKGFSAETIWMPDLMISALEKFRFLDSDASSLERERRENVKSDLERILPREIASQLKEMLREKKVNCCAILLRCGALYPFVHVSTLLSSLEGLVGCTVVVGYPGDREGQMLNEKGESIRSYYRAVII